MKKLILIVTLISSIFVMAQKEDKLPYHEIPEYTENYSAGTVASRMIDGLGFRYFWATDGIREEDLNYRPSESGRSCEETIDHIFWLSNVIRNSISLEKSEDKIKELSFDEKRRQTLLNFKEVSDILKTTEDISKFDNEKFPFWNLINGPISDAIWHCGQVVMLRRVSGNPFNSKVSLFAGKLRE
ncbi:hypothetical protein WJN01_12685 [Flavobacteriaceae bacterium SZ-1-7]|uniref:hypothetical protein n=1 Tax=Tamlana sedimenti TaxID=3134126 RepID=UPI003123EE37